MVRTLEEPFIKYKHRYNDLKYNNDLKGCNEYQHS